MKTIVIHIPDPLKTKLDVLRTQGYTINGYVCAVLGRALADRPTRHGHVTLTYRKPGGAWRRRTVPTGQVTRTILKLEDQGAEVVTRETEEGGAHGTTR
jgi:hypothetical protein